ncbi:MAG: 4-(cytidine 5'-diphospho)-2-C-methyl-D-erythritol kinase, partial [Actinomycetota bacterium]|nr:4-(cytidine 5'-diphospho)-2-C-methyl-D-erythritol kinase [Actinomycetota bacterium]
MTTVTVRAPAKINLGLSVGAAGADGFHAVATVYQSISLYDEIKAREADPGSYEIKLTGEGADHLPLDETNLALRAARVLAAAYRVDHGVNLSIHKTIAVAGGLAGGSTDAAGALVACDALWGTGASRAELSALAAQLGSDVPFCLTGGLAVGTGRGETISPVLARGMYEWVLAYGDSGLPTGEVYAQLDRLRGPERPQPPAVREALMTALRTGDP